MSFKGQSGDAMAGVEAVLRQIAQVPAPPGLEERMQACLRQAPRRESLWQRCAVALFGDLLRESDWLHSGAMRAAAAVAVAAVVLGGGWGVTAHLGPAAFPQNARQGPVLTAPGGFSSAGAIRTPQTLQGPVVAAPAAALKAPGQNAAGQKARPAKKKSAGAKKE
jgi:hypothetical protein